MWVAGCGDKKLGDVYIRGVRDWVGGCSGMRESLFQAAERLGASTEGNEARG